MSIATIKTYYQLAKPGIIYGNLLTAIGGFLFAANGHIDVTVMLAAVLGIALVIAAGCVYNNYLDQGIDIKMARTKKRALVTGRVSNTQALLYAGILLGTGFVVLIIGTNLLTVLLGVVAIIDYVILYGWTKRKTIYGTIVGSVSGALPIVGGYTAVTGHFDGGAWLLFLIMVCWQMPHFYAIAMYRYDDYAAASLPVLPVKKGMRVTKYNILGFILAFIITCISLTTSGYAGYSFLVVMTLFGFIWLWKGLAGLKITDDAKWARGMFFYSLLGIIALPVMLAGNFFLP